MEDEYAGRVVRCPACKSVVNVPEGSDPPPAVRSVRVPRVPAGYREPVRRFGFNCPWCSSRLEATMAMAGQKGQCPTCANDIRIPYLDYCGRLVDPDSKQIIKPDPHPVHAYAAAGERAPTIERDESGAQRIKCSRCGGVSPVTANSCNNCGVPFTLEGTVQVEQSNSNGYATSSLILGVLGIATCMIFVPSVLAIVFGIVALVQLRGEDAKGARITAIAGIICGAAGLALNLLMALS